MGMLVTPLWGLAICRVLWFVYHADVICSASQQYTRTPAVPTGPRINFKVQTHARTRREEPDQDCLFHIQNKL